MKNRKTTKYGDAYAIAMGLADAAVLLVLTVGSPALGGPDNHKCRQPRYVLRTFDVPTEVPVSPGIGTMARGINNHGQIVGVYPKYAADGMTVEWHGFVFSKGAFSDVAVPEAAATDLFKINGCGIAVGDYYDADGNDFVFIRRPDGRIHLLPPLMPDAAFIGEWIDINNQGAVAGTFYGPDVRLQGYIFEHGTYTVFNYPDAGMTALRAMNDCGTVGGFWVDEAGIEIGFEGYANGHGFLRHRDGSLVAIDAPGARDNGTLGATFPSGINNREEVVGCYVDSDDHTHGFVLSKGVFTTLDFPNDEGTSWATDINDQGVIVGTYGSGLNHGFIAIPVRDRD